MRNTEDFIEKATEVHNGRFNYSLVEYKRATEKVKIICENDHIFEQTPNGHLSGNGCNICFKLKVGEWNRKSKEEFIKDACIVHGNLFDYSNVQYERGNKPINILCRNGHSFWQTPENHLAGKGCKFCNRLPVLTTDLFVSEANKIHGEKFNYSLVEYKDRRTPVSIICDKGHIFQQPPASHLKGFGCAKCACVGSYTQDEFIEKAKMVHGDKYDYSLVKYLGSQTKVVIKCIACGNIFNQIPASHLKGCGCANCAETGYRVLSPGSLYVLSDGFITKIGITNRQVADRVRDINRDSGKSFEIIWQEKFEDGGLPKMIEGRLLKTLKSSYPQPTEVFDGYTECFLNVEKDYLIAEIGKMKQIIEEQNDSNRPEYAYREN